MNVKIASLAADLKKEREGDWIDVKDWPGLNPEKPLEITPLPGLAFNVRSTNYPPYATARQNALEKLKQDYPDGNIPSEVTAKIEGELSIEHLLIGWKGLDVDYTPEFAQVVMVAEEHRTLRQMVGWCAGRVGKRQVEFVEAAAKN
ncbi:hypothetical protein EN802_13590 [bacterium M00.F.Ca.ET.159.01.1.1]|nr:hypothetical protein EN802_13590 [bacterium M00.F.Ca.ET.159.01.1.1]